MCKLATLLLTFSALFAQDSPPAAVPPTPAPVVNPVIENSGKPMLVPFKCTDEDIHTAGLTCSEDDPCPVYLELSAVEATDSGSSPQATCTPEIRRFSAFCWAVMITG